MSALAAEGGAQISLRKTLSLELRRKKDGAFCIDFDFNLSLGNNKEVIRTAMDLRVNWKVLPS